MPSAATIRWFVLAAPLFSASLASSSVDPIGYRFVTGDVVNVRKSPKAGAPILAKLRINTQVEVLAEENGFARIRLRLPAGELAGYISKDAVGPEQVTFEGARKRASELASSPEHRLEARAWAERAVALDGSSDEALQALATLFDDPASTKARAHIRDILEGKASAWIALCRENPEGAFPRASRYRVEVLFRLDAGAKVGPAFESTEGAAPAAAKPRSTDLSGAQWFVLDAHGSRQVDGTPFALAREVDAWNESREGEPPSPIGGGAGGRLILGACSQAGAVYSTQPLRALTPALGSSDFTRAVTALAPMVLSSEEGFRGQIESVEGRTFEGVSEVRLGLGGDWKGNEGCAGGRSEAHAWGVVTPSGQVLAQLGVLGALGVTDATDAARFQLKRGEGARIFVGVAMTNACEKGINYQGQVLVLPAKGEPVKSELVLGGEGC